MDEDVLDYQLRQLVSEAQHLSNTPKQGKVLNKLIKTIQDSGRLSSFYNWRNHPDFEDIYDEALAKTFTGICKNIHKYRPEYKVMAWVNRILNWRFYDVLNQSNRQRILSLDELNSFNNGSNAQSDDEDEIALLRGFIEDDPESILKNSCINKDKNANLQVVLLMRLDDKRWEDISQKLGHSIQRLSELYQRSLKKRKIIDYFRKYLQ